MKREVIIGVVTAVITTAVTLFFSAMLGLFSAKITDSQLGDLASKIVDEPKYRNILFRNFQESGAFSSLLREAKLSQLQGFHFSGIYCRWKNGEINCDESAHSWDGAVNIDLKNSGSVVDNRMTIRFTENYKGDPVCHVSFENIIAFSTIDPDDNGVKIYIYRPSGQEFFWREVPDHTFILLSCWGEM